MQCKTEKTSTINHLKHGFDLHSNQYFYLISKTLSLCIRITRRIFHSISYKFYRASKTFRQKRISLQLIFSLLQQKINMFIQIYINTYIPLYFILKSELTKNLMCKHNLKYKRYKSEYLEEYVLLELSAISMIHLLNQFCI